MTENEADQHAFQMVRDYLKTKGKLACLTDRLQKASGGVSQVDDNMKLVERHVPGPLLSAWDGVDCESLSRDMEALREQSAEKQRLETLLRDTEFADVIDSTG